MLWIFLAVFANICESLAGITYKKSLGIAPWINFISLTLYEATIGLVFSAVLVGVGCMWHLSAIQIGLLSCSVVAYFAREPILQKIWQNEAVARILPYENLRTFFVLIISYAFFHKAHFTTLCVALLALCILAIGSFERWNFSIPRMIGWIFISEMLMAMTLLVNSYLLFSVPETSVFVWTYILWFGALSVGALSIRDRFVGDMRKGSWSFHGYIFASSVCTVLGWYIELWIISEVGVIVSVLLGFLTILVTIGLSALFLGDRPTKRDIVLATIITPLAALGVYIQ